MLLIVKMESSVSTPHCSLIIYLAKDAGLVPTFLQDVRSFFAKFPVHYEVIAVVEKSADDCAKAIQEQQKLSPTKESLRLEQNAKTLGRAQSMIQGLNRGQAPALLLLNAEMASPLGDVFKLWQHLVAEEQSDIVWGDRYSKKDSPFQSSVSPRIRTEHFFNQILRGKDREDALEDPLCEVLAIRKSAWEKIRSELATKKVKGWYLSAALQKCTAIDDMKIIEVPIFDSGATSPSYSTWKERWYLMTSAR